MQLLIILGKMKKNKNHIKDHIKDRVLSLRILSIWNSFYCYHLLFEHEIEIRERNEICKICARIQT